MPEVIHSHSREIVMTMINVNSRSDRGQAEFASLEAVALESRGFPHSVRRKPVMLHLPTLTLMCPRGNRAGCTGLVALSGWLAAAIPLAAQPAAEAVPAVIKSSAPQVDPVRPSADALEIAPAPGRPGVRVGTTALRPKIDGKLDDRCWHDAVVIRDFTQVEPKEGAAPSERTEVRLVHDRDYLCIAVRCFDRKPEKIIAKQMQRDAGGDSDDTVTLTFDTFGRKRTGYFFKIAAGGAIQDALLEADGTKKAEWDTVWYGRTLIDDEGWTTEISIPFKSLSFDVRSAAWGFNVERTIRRKQEIVRWAAPYQNKTVTSLADLGELKGLSDIKKGLGFEFKPFLVARYGKESDSGESDFELEQGFDLFYGITPSLTASLTVNTDFAETDVDKRQVNLTRFPLFFPEKRDFFLQDANLFSFAAYKGPLAFHSRRIGLGPSGETVDIIAGGKLTGRIGNLELGLLDIQVDDTDGVPSKNLAVAHATYRLMEESSIGGIFTYGDPHSPGDNSLAGVSLNYRNSHVDGNNVFNAQAWLMNTDTPERDGREMAFGGSLRYPNEPFFGEVYASQIDADFNPALGFVRRRGIRQYGGKFGYRWRPGGRLRSVGIQVQPFYVTNLDNEIETEAVVLPGIDFLNEAGDSLSLGITRNRENFSEGFEMVPGVEVPGGDYRFNRAYALLASTSARPLSAFASVDVGGLYDGDSRDYGAGFEWRVNKHAALGTEVTLSQIDLPTGNADVVVGGARANLSFNPRVSWNTVVQYDNVSETVGINSRLKWIVRPGSNIFLVANYGYDVEDGTFRTLSRELTTKIGWTFRF
jgi:hypothetical protein